MSATTAAASNSPTTTTTTTVSDSTHPTTVLTMTPGRLTIGLTAAQLAPFANDPFLIRARELFAQRSAELAREFPELWALPETEKVVRLQEGFHNFYAPDAVNPYVAVAACGPWIITSEGAVLHDNGGYGMLGLGHSPIEVEQVLAQPQSMANIMTASFSQHRFVNQLFDAIGTTRPENSRRPYCEFMMLNSGSEASSLAMRITDVYAKHLTEPHGKHAGWKVRTLSLTGAFHGRTYRAGQLSNSSYPSYQKHLASYRKTRALTVPPNDIEALRDVFRMCDEEKLHIEVMALEPVMGEGNPGLSITPEFYAEARRLTREHDTLLLVDSIQAGLRCHGVLSITDYPGFQTLDPPDLETFSKAINAGQFPVSVLALGEHASKTYRRGLYGNTMTTNPRACDVGTAVLRAVMPLRENIVSRGQEFLEKLKQLSSDFPHIVTSVQGTGLLLSAEINPQYFKVVGHGGLEELLRRFGIGVIHGGENSLRFTPHFRITSNEIDLVMEVIRYCLTNLAHKTEVQGDSHAH